MKYVNVWNNFKTDNHFNWPRFLHDLNIVYTIVHDLARLFILIFYKCF